MPGIDELAKPDEEEGEGWGTIKVYSPACELGASVGSASGLVQLLRTKANPARSFRPTRANTHHAQSASERESVEGSDRRPSVGPVRVSLRPLDSADAGKSVGGCTIYEPW